MNINQEAKSMYNAPSFYLHLVYHQPFISQKISEVWYYILFNSILKSKLHISTSAKQFSVQMCQNIYNISISGQDPGGSMS